MEYTEKRWRCDNCGRDVKRGVMPPPGWHEVSGFYGVWGHCCSDPACQEWTKRMCKENGFACESLGIKAGE